MLKVSYWDMLMSVVVMRHQQFPLNDNSYITGPIFTKLHRNVPQVTLYKIAKRNLICRKTWPPGGAAYRGNKNFEDLLL